MPVIGMHHFDSKHPQRQPLFPRSCFLIMRMAAILESTRRSSCMPQNIIFCIFYFILATVPAFADQPSVEGVAYATYTIWELPDNMCAALFPAVDSNAALQCGGTARRISEYRPRLTRGGSNFSCSVAASYLCGASHLQ